MAQGPIERELQGVALHHKEHVFYLTYIIYSFNISDFRPERTLDLGYQDGSNELQNLIAEMHDPGLSISIM